MSGSGKVVSSSRVHSDSRRPASTIPPSHRRQDSLGQTVIDTEDNLSDKEVYPSQHHVTIPAIEITKDSASEGRNSMDYSDEDYLGQRRDRRGAGGVGGGGRGRVGPRGVYDPRMSAPAGGAARKTAAGSHHHHHPPTSAAHPPPSTVAPPLAQSRNVRTFVALFDYDPKTMSPNPGAFMEELPFREGQLIKIYGDKDPDGFYWGEVGNRQGFVPCNMVSQVQGGEHEENASRRAVPPPRRDANFRGHPTKGAPTNRGSMERWNDDYDMVPVKKMVALYDYDPQELSPNVDADVELSFSTGDIIYVYGDMDEDGFFMGEMNGVRGLVPSNFLAEAPVDYLEDGRRHPSGGPTQDHHSGNVTGSRGYDANSTPRRTPHPADTSSKYNFHPRSGGHHHHPVQQPLGPAAGQAGPPQQRW